MPYKHPQKTGIAFGNPYQGEAELVFIPLALPEDFGSAEEALRTVRAWFLGEHKINGTTAFMGWGDVKYALESPPGWIGVIGRGRDLSVLFRWNKKKSAIDALREIEQAEGGLPAWLCAGLYTASLAVEHAVDPQSAASAVYFAASSCSVYPCISNPAFLSRKELERLVDTEPLSQLVGSATPKIRSGVDYARVFNILGSRILDEQWYKPRRSAIDPAEDPIFFNRLSFFGASKLCLDKDPKILISQIPLRIRLSTGKMVDGQKNLQTSSAHGIMEAATVVYDYMIRSSPSASALRAFFPEGVLDATQFQKAIEVFEALYRQNHPSALHLANSLIDEADQLAAYAPQGMYRVVLSEEIPIFSLGVRALNVFFDADRMWVQLLFSDPCPTLIPWNARDFRKNPEEHPYSFSLMMAALWHDFRVSAEDSFPEEKNSTTPPPRAEPPAETSIPPHAIRKRESVRMLPVAHRGHRVWGYQVEREYLARRRHLVGAFRRRLPQEHHRREDALTLAAEFGIVLPDEHFTIVLPHARGGNPARVPNSIHPQAVRSRGLATSIAFANFIRELEGTSSPEASDG
jgi:hypothetical protein